MSSDEESEDEMPLAKLSKKNPNTPYSQFPMRDLTMSAMSMGGMSGMDGIGGVGMGGEMGRVEREQAELRAVIPTGRAVFDGIGVGGWEENGNVVENGNEGGFWGQRYERDVVGMVDGDNKPRKSV